MKHLLPLLFLVSCHTSDPVRLVGNTGTEINLGKRTTFAAQSYLNAGFDKNGNPRITMRDKSEAVPNKALNVAGTYGGALIAGNLAEAVSAHGSAEVINASNNAAAIAAGKEATKQLSIKAGAATEALKITTP